MCTFSFVLTFLNIFLQVSDTKKTSKVVLKIVLTKNPSFWLYYQIPSSVTFLDFFSNFLLCVEMGTLYFLKQSFRSKTFSVFLPSQLLCRCLPQWSKNFMKLHFNLLFQEPINQRTGTNKSALTANLDKNKDKIWSTNTVYHLFVVLKLWWHALHCKGCSI